MDINEAIDKIKNMLVDNAVLMNIPSTKILFVDSYFLKMASKVSILRGAAKTPVSEMSPVGL